MVSAVSGRGHQGIQKGQSLPEHCRGSVRTPSLDTQVPCGVRLLRMPHFHHRLPRAQFGFHLTPGRHEVQMGVGVPNPPSPQLGPRVGHSHSPALGQLVTVRLAPSVGGWCHYDAILQVQRERSWPQGCIPGSRQPQESAGNRTNYSVHSWRSGDKCPGDL